MAHGVQSYQDNDLLVQIPRYGETSLLYAQWQLAGKAAHEAAAAAKMGASSRKKSWPRLLHLQLIREWHVDEKW